MPYQLNLSPLSVSWVETTNNGMTYDWPHGNMGCPTHRQNKPFVRQNEPHSALGRRPPAPEAIVSMDQRPIMH